MHVDLFNEKNMKELVITNFSTRGADSRMKVSSYGKEPGKDQYTIIIIRLMLLKNVEPAYIVTSLGKDNSLVIEKDCRIQRAS